MSSYRITAIADRVVVVHDMVDSVAISEIDAEQASLLLRQLRAALRAARRGAQPIPLAAYGSPIWSADAAG